MAQLTEDDIRIYHSQLIAACEAANGELAVAIIKMIRVADAEVADQLLDAAVAQGWNNLIAGLR